MRNTITMGLVAVLATLSAAASRLPAHRLLEALPAEAGSPARPTE